MLNLGVAYFGNRFISHAQEDLKRIAESCDYVVHTVSETDLNYHKAVLAKLMLQSRKLGLEVWADPWGLGGVFGGEALSRFLIEHRESWQIMSNGKIVPSACLNRPEWRSFVKEWVLNIRDMGAQVVFWDEPHIAFDFESEWEGIYSCTCQVCQQVFKKKYGSPLPARLTPAAREFRRETMTGFIADILSFTHVKGLRNAVCLYAYKGNEEYDQLWKVASSYKDLDILGCDPYWRWAGRRRDAAAHVQEYSRHIAGLCKANNKGSQIWIQAMRLPAGAENEIEHAIDAAAGEGVSHIAAWSYDGGELLDPVLSESPENVWLSVENVFKRLRNAR